MKKTLIFILLSSISMQTHGNSYSNNHENKHAGTENKSVAADTRLVFTRDQAICLTPQEESIMNLFDGNLTTSWFPGWGAMYPASTLLDMKGSFNISKFRFKNYTGDRTFNIYGGKDAFHLTLIVSQYVTGYDQWIEVPANIQVNYLKLELPQSKTDSPTELEIYGAKVADALMLPGTGKFREQNNINGILGVNSFHWVNTALETPFNTVREYVESEWIEQAPGKFRFNPSSAGDAMFDDHYAQLRSMGIEILPCLKGTLPWTRAAGYDDNEYKPIYPLTANPADPLSYKEQAKFHYQYAARYGYTKVSDALLDIDPTQRWTGDPINVKKSGLGFIKYFECWNEPDKDWKGPNGYMTPFEFAAYMSAVADGHCNTMGTKVGIKNADPTAKVVMGGLCNFSLDYVKAMILWFQTYRPDHSVPIDVFNFHHYSNSAGFQFASGSVGISPEQDRLREKLIAIKSYIDANFPGKEIFFSEYGYDSNIGSIQRSEPIGTMSRTEVQGIWNTRSMLEIMAAQIDKSYAYIMEDDSPSEDSWGVFTNCGMVTPVSTGSIKKPGWYYINTLKSTLKDYKFIANESPNANIRKYKFSNGSKTIYAVWLTSTSDAKAPYLLSLPNITSADIISLADKNATGLKNTVATNGSVNLQISERPIFIVVNNTAVVNSIPVANAGPDLNLVSPARTITISGKGTDADGTITGYAWTQKSGPTATLTNATTAAVTVTTSASGTYTLQLSVTDNRGATGIDEVVLTVSPASLYVSSLVLADADKDIDIAPLTSNYVLNLAAQTSTFTFVAKTVPMNVGSVKFLWDGVEFKTVKGSPYSFTDNCWPGYNCYNGWWRPTAGTHTVTAIPYSDANATGIQGSPYSITFNVINSASRIASPIGESNTLTEATWDATISPNPVREEMMVNIGGEVSDAKISIVDGMGRSYYENNNVNSGSVVIPAAQLGMKQGIYFAKISKGNSVVKVVKIVKE